VLSGLCSSASDLDITSALQTEQSPKWKNPYPKSKKIDTYQEGVLQKEEFAGSKYMLMSQFHHSYKYMEASEMLYQKCSEYPWMCQAPFNCESWEAYDTYYVAKYGVGNRTGSNLRSWCMPGLDHYGPYLNKCLVEKDLKAAAETLFNTQYEKALDDIDASWCFLEGHCTNKLVTDDTNPNDAELMCDYRFQHKHWVMNFNSALKKVLDNTTIQPTLVTAAEGIKSQRVARYMTKLSCAQGTYHCDVMYCKHQYCKNEFYVNKFKKLLPSIEGQKIRDFDELPKGAALQY